MCLGMGTNVFADTENAELEGEKYFYTDVKTGMNFSCVKYDDKNLITKVTIGEDEAVVEVIDGEYYLNGKFIAHSTVDTIASIAIDTGDNGANPQVDTSGVTWGDWITKTGEISVYKLTIAGITAILGSWLVSNGFWGTFATITVAGLIVQAGYDMIKVKMRARIGYDKKTKYNYGQQEITLYGKKDGGEYKKFYGPKIQTQKKPDK